MSGIARVDVFTYRVTYAHGTYVMSRGRQIDGLDSVVARVTTVDGVERLRRGVPARARTTYEAHAGGRNRGAARTRTRA